MRLPRYLIVLIALAVFAAGAWFLARRQSGAGGKGVPSPGNEVNVGLGRGAVIVEGDAADPIEMLNVMRSGKLLDDAAVWMRWDKGCAVAFCDVDAGPMEVQVRTRYRKTSYLLEPVSFRMGVQLRAIDLELPPGFQPLGVPDTALAFSPDSRRLAIASASGELRVLAPVAFDNRPQAEGLFERRIREGIAKTLSFAAGGEVLLLGEQSPDGFVLGLDGRDGRELWRMRLADELESSRPSASDYLALYSFPGAFRLIALPDGDALVLGLHSWRPDSQTRRALARIYRLDARTGKPRWRYPVETPAGRNITWMDATPDGARVACVMSLPGAGQAGAAEAPLDLVVLDGATGAEAGRLTLPPLKPHFTSTMCWQSLSLHPGGRSAVLGADDGRLWMVDLDASGRPKERWRMDLGTPIQVGALNVHCPIGWALNRDQGVFVELDTNWEKFGAAAQTARPADVHPEASSIQAFDPQAATPERLWRYTVPGRPQGLWLSADNRWLAFAYEKPEGADSLGRPTPPDYGVLMFDLRREGGAAKKLQYQFSTEGPLGFAGCFSPDGRYLAVTEGPRPGTDRLSATRTYRVLILH